MKYLFAFIILFSTGLQAAPKVTTIAGPENLNNTFGVIVGPEGDVYFCDTGNHQIKKISRRGNKVSTVVGSGKKGYSGDGGPPLAADLFEPYEIRFHPGGDLYWVEMQNHIVRKLDARTNLVSTVAGTGTAGFSGDDGLATAAQLNRPHSIQFDLAGKNLYICDIKNNRIRKVNMTTGIITTWCGNGKKDLTPNGIKVGPTVPLRGPRALDIDHKGDLWLALREGNALYRIDSKDQTLHHIAGTGKKGFIQQTSNALETPLSGPKGVAISPDGNWVYLADTESHTVRAVNVSTTPHQLHTIVGDGSRGDGPDTGDPLKCRMARLHGVGTDPINGDLYIGDSETNKIRKVTGLPGATQWKTLNQYRSETFEVDGIKCRVTQPDNPKPGNPWIWRCRFYGAFPALDEALLASGWHIGWTEVDNLFGGPEAMQRFDAFYKTALTKYQLNPNPVMEGFSRGGLPALNWAIKNPDKTLAVYLDAAVMDIHSWPRKKSAKLFLTALKAYGLDLDSADQWQGPLDNLEPLIKAKLPIFIVAGGDDSIVPYPENTGILETRYRQAGAPIEAIVKASCGHHPHGLYGPANFTLVEKLETLFSQSN